MECRSLTGVKFGPRSMEAIGEFRRKHHLMRVLGNMVPVGTMAAIFVGNGSFESSFTIMITDFHAFGEAMKSLPSIERRVLSDIAQYAALDTAGAESEFWRQIARGIQDGCSYRF